jgi:hypothetical protein
MSFGQSQVAAKQSEWTRIQAADAQRRQRSAMIGEQRDIMVKNAATPQTLRKLDRPVIDRLLEQGAIDSDQHRAGVEINRIWIQITSALHIRGADYERVGGGGGTTGFLPNIFTCGYQERYLPWARETGGVVVTGGHTLLDVVIKMVVDNYGQRQIATMIGSDQRRVLRLLREALFRYGELAGWIDRPLLSGPTPLVEKAA